MKRPPKPVSVRSGHLEFLRVNATNWAWRDLYHWLLSLSWPRFAVFLFGVYVGVNALFAALYLAVPGGIAEMRPGSLSDAFFFSVETLATVGYGHMYPVSMAGHLVATTEIVLGMFGMAVITGLIFVRFSRPRANLLFSRNLVISEFDGKPTLMMRVANQRHQPMVQAQFRLMAVRTEELENGDTIARFHELRLQIPSVIVFPAAMTLRHPIDEDSPLHGMGPEDFEREHVRFMASAVCVDSVVSAAVHGHESYEHTDVRFGERFVEIYTEAPGHGRWVVDYGRIHETEPVTEG